ncbi:hypothetical protein CEP54_002467 [Fusarium duplospermum]|uniref:Uncharacterized protein n=1 Tax=Fusarium duplospermum TaxID=1325734 RepID=A0A428QVD3_9HYPO|nr:hypothetical protein CEP54_002467 [Fusarium duplospermum]
MASQDVRDQSVTPPVYAPTPLGLAEILRDPDTTQNRQPGMLIARPSDLSAEEKATTMDLLQKWCSRQAGGVQPLTLTVRINVFSSEPPSTTSPVDLPPAQQAPSPTQSGPLPPSSARAISPFPAVAPHPEREVKDWIFDTEENTAEARADFEAYVDQLLRNGGGPNEISTGHNLIDTSAPEHTGLGWGGYDREWELQGRPIDPESVEEGDWKKWDGVEFGFTYVDPTTGERRDGDVVRADPNSPDAQPPAPEDMPMTLYEKLHQGPQPGV